MSSMTETCAPPVFPSGEGFYRSLLDNLHDGVYFVDRDRRITYWNRGAERITGYRAGDVIGSCCSDNLLVHVDAEGCQLCLEKCPLLHTIHDQSPREAEVFLKHRDGQRIPVMVRVAPLVDDQGTTIGAVETFSDNSSKLAAVQMAKLLNRMAYCDNLTETGNRRYTDARLLEDLTKSRQTQSPMGLLFLDIDCFKSINDEFGHDAGDRVLQMTATTLTSNLQPWDFVGRWGGDEFVVILNNSTVEQTRRTARRLRALIASSRVPAGRRMAAVTVSIGVTEARCEDSPESIIKRADELLYRSKRDGRNRVTCYFPGETAPAHTA